MGTPAFVFDPQGNPGTIPQEELAGALRDGFSLRKPSPAEEAADLASDSPVRSFVTGAASTLTGGLTDPIAKRLTGLPPSLAGATVSAQKSSTPGVVGQVAGFAGGLMTGGSEASFPGMVSSLGKATVEKALASGGSKLASKVAGGMTESGVLGLSQLFSENSLEDQPLTAEHAATTLLGNVIGGGVISGAFHGLATGASKVSSMAKAGNLGDTMKKLADKADDAMFATGNGKWAQDNAAIMPDIRRVGRAEGIMGGKNAALGFDQAAKADLAVPKYDAAVDALAPPHLQNEALWRTLAAGDGRLAEEARKAGLKDAILEIGKKEGVLLDETVGADTLRTIDEAVPKYDAAVEALHSKAMSGAPSALADEAGWRVLSHKNGKWGEDMLKAGFKGDILRIAKEEGVDLAQGPGDALRTQASEALQRVGAQRMNNPLRALDHAKPIPTEELADDVMGMLGKKFHSPLYESAIGSVRQDLGIAKVVKTADPEGAEVLDAFSKHPAITWQELFKIQSNLSPVTEAGGVVSSYSQDVYNAVRKELKGFIEAHIEETLGADTAAQFKEGFKRYSALKYVEKAAEAGARKIEGGGALPGFKEHLSDLVKDSGGLGGPQMEAAVKQQQAAHALRDIVESKFKRAESGGTLATRGEKLAEVLAEQRDLPPQLQQALKDQRAIRALRDAAATQAARIEGGQVNFSLINGGGIAGRAVGGGSQGAVLGAGIGSVVKRRWGFLVSAGLREMADSSLVSNLATGLRAKLPGLPIGLDAVRLQLENALAHSDLAGLAEHASTLASADGPAYAQAMGIGGLPDSPDKMTALNALSGFHDGQNSRSDSAIKGFLGEKPGSPSKPREGSLSEFRAIVPRLQAAVNNPEGIHSSMPTNLTGAAPVTTGMATAVALQGAQFLLSKTPKDPGAGLPPGLRQHWEPSGIELKRWFRYVDAVENPTAVVERAKKGSLSPEGKEVLQSLYPNLYADLSRRFLERMGTAAGPLPYLKRKVIMDLLDGPGGVSQAQAQQIQAIHATFQGPQGPQNSPKPDGRQSRDVQKNYETQSQRLEGRQNGAANQE